MTQLRFNNLLVLHVHKDRTNSLQLTACLNEFVSGSEHRSSLWKILSFYFSRIYVVKLVFLSNVLWSENLPELRPRADPHRIRG